MRVIVPSPQQAWGFCGAKQSLSLLVISSKSPDEMATSRSSHPATQTTMVCIKQPSGRNACLLFRNTWERTNIDDDVSQEPRIQDVFRMGYSLSCLGGTEAWSTSMNAPD